MASARSEDWEVVHNSGRASPVPVAPAPSLAPSGAPVPSPIPGTPQPITPSQDPEALLCPPAPRDGETLQLYAAGADSPTTPAPEGLEQGLASVVGSDFESDFSSDEEGGPMDGSTVLVPPPPSTGIWTRLKK